MKTFFTKKRIAFLSIMNVSLLLIIFLLIVPIGSLSERCFVYSTELNEFVTFDTNGYVPIFKILHSPFTIGSQYHTKILVVQTIVFTFVAIIFSVFTILFTIELKRAGVFEKLFTHHPTKAEQMQAQIDELQRQVDELKKGE